MDVHGLGVKFLFFRNFHRQRSGYERQPDAVEEGEVFLLLSDREANRILDEALRETNAALKRT